MSRHWREPLDPAKHIDFMSDNSVGGRPVSLPTDNLHRPWVYFVSVCSFTFQFHSLPQLQECLAHFRVKLHPADREHGVVLEHYWQPWHQRLPQRLFAESKRVKVVHALERALTAFSSSKNE